MRALPAKVHEMFMPLREIVGSELHQAIVLYVTQHFDHTIVGPDWDNKMEGETVFVELMNKLTDFRTHLYYNRVENRPKEENTNV